MLEATTAFMAAVLSILSGPELLDQLDMGPLGYALFVYVTIALVLLSIFKYVDFALAVNSDFAENLKKRSNMLGRLRLRRRSG